MILRILSIPLVISVLLTHSLADSPTTSPPPGSRTSTSDAIPSGFLPAFEAFRTAEKASMRGDPRLALESYNNALDRVAEHCAQENSALLSSLEPELEVIMRRIFQLARKTGDYADTHPIFSRWKEILDKETSLANLAALVTFNLGVTTAYSTGRLDTAKEIWKPLGFLHKWWVIGPFDNERGGGFSTTYGAEEDQRPDASISHQGKNRKVSWRKVPTTPLTGWMDLDVLMYPRDQALAYALTFVHSERSAEAVIHLGSDEGYKVWVNGEEVASRDIHRLMRFDQDILGIHLQKGWNSILLKVTEAEDQWEFRARIGAPNGKPLDGWEERFPPDDAELPPSPAQVLATSSSENKDKSDSQNTVEPPPGSLDQLKQRLDDNPQSQWNHYLMGVLYQDRQAHDILTEHPDREAFRRAIQLHEDPVPAIYHHQFAIANRRKRGVTADRDENAWRTALENAIQTEPPSLVAMTQLARYYFTNFGNLLRAEELLQSALQQNPNYIEARILQGRVDGRRQFPDALRKALDGCHASGLVSPTLLHDRARQLRNAGNTAKAEELLRAYLSKNRFQSRIRDELASLLLDSNRTDEAIEFHEEWIQFMPYSLSTREEVVSILKGKEEYERALEIQKDIVEISPGDPDLQRDKGDLLWQLGRQEEAFEAWEQALKLQPNFPDLREYLDFLKKQRDAFVVEFRRDLSTNIQEALKDSAFQKDDATQKDDQSAPDGNDPVDVLLDITAIRVNADGTSKKFHQQLLRILNDRGISLYNKYRTYYADGEQRVEYKAVRVIHGDGSEEHARLGVFEGNYNGNGNYRAATVDVPPLEKGDLLEVQYITEDIQQGFFGDYYGHREYFLSTFPMHQKTFILRVPSSRKFHFHQRKFSAVPMVSKDMDHETTTYTWNIKDVDKMRPEPGMPPDYEALPALEISTFENWQAFSSWYENLIRKQFESSPEIKSKVSELTSGQSTDLEKIESLYHFVVQDIRYNAWEFGIHGFKPYNAPTIFARRFGDCKDKATLLSTMLNEAGILSYPVLIKAVDSRGDEDLTLPMVHHFNHCITYVPSGDGYEEMFLDGTAQFNGLKELPSMDRGARVLVVKPGLGAIQEVPWNESTELMSTEEIQVSLKEDQSAQINIRVLVHGDYASTIRQFFEIPGKRQKNLEKIYGRRFAGLEVEEQSFSDLEDLSVPVQFHARLHVPNFIQPAPEGLSLKPLDDFWQTSEFFQNLSSLEKRSKDLVLGNPRRSELTVTYYLPSNYKIKTLPQELSFEDRFGKLNVTYQKETGHLTMKRFLEITSTRINRQNYERFRGLAGALERLKEMKILIGKEKT